MLNIVVLVVICTEQTGSVVMLVINLIGLLVAYKNNLRHFCRISHQFKKIDKQNERNLDSSWLPQSCLEYQVWYLCVNFDSFSSMHTNFRMDQFKPDSAWEENAACVSGTSYPPPPCIPGYTMPRHRVPPGTRCLGMEYPPNGGTPFLGTVYPRYTVPRHRVPRPWGIHHA